MLEFSPTAGALDASATLKIAAEARRLTALGVAVAPFAAGEPDFNTPAHIRAAGIRAIETGQTKYTPAAGLSTLREAVADTLALQGFEGLTADRTMVSVGAKGALYLAMTVIVRPGDEVIMATPTWLSYPKVIQAAGGTCVFVPTRPEDGFHIDPDRIRSAVTPRTRLLVLNSPGNPSGAVQPDEVHREIGRIAAEHGIAVISDEIYEHLTYAPARFRSFADQAPDARPLTMIVNGVSKAFAMTGWRLGYAGGPAPWIRQMIRLQGHAFSGPSEVAQRAALAALTGPIEPVMAMRAAFRERRDVMHTRLSRIPDVRATLPVGAFYVLPDVSAYYGRHYEGVEITDAACLAQLLLEHAHVAVIPGDVFEAPYALRFSYACGLEQIEAGLDRVATFFSAIT